MNPLESIINNFQNLVTQVPEAAQPLIVALAGAIPFVEGEVASVIGIVGGINPVVAGISGAAGNFLCVLLVVMLSSRARTAVIDRRAARTEMSTGYSDAGTVSTVTDLETEMVKPESKGRARFNVWLVRFGVPGASLLGPLAIPTQFTSAILIAGGTPKSWVLLWQGIAIILWTTISTVTVSLALRFVVGV